MWIRFGIVAIVVAAGGGCSSGDGGTKRSAAPQGTQTYTGLSRGHTDAPVSYPQTPPVGGDHAPVWQNCGFYGQAVLTGRGVHSMEHGAVWVTYRPGHRAYLR